MSDKIREEFEARFCLPKEARWEADQYRYFGNQSSPAMIDFIEFCGRWQGWQASRESIYIEWPDHYEYTNSDVAGAAILDCRTAFQKAIR